MFLHFQGFFNTALPVPFADESAYLHILRFYYSIMLLSSNTVGVIARQTDLSQLNARLFDSSVPYEHSRRIVMRHSEKILPLV